MKLPPLPKLPSFKMPKPKPKRLQASARRAVQPAMDDYDDEPTTRLSSAFVVVLLLHLVAVGGIYAFNSIKAHRRGDDRGSQNTANATSKTTSTTTAGTAHSSAVNSSAPVQASNVSTPPAVPSAPVVTPISGNRVHHVKTGDTLIRIAGLYGVTKSDLVESNGLKDEAALRPGQVLNIPSAKQATKPVPTEARKVETAARRTDSTPAKATAAASAAPRTYTVKKGDNPVSIARRHGVSYDDLLKLNKIDDPKKLRVDQVLKIPAPR